MGKLCAAVAVLCLVPQLAAATCTNATEIKEWRDNVPNATGSDLCVINWCTEQAT